MFRRKFASNQDTGDGALDLDGKTAYVALWGSACLAAFYFYLKDWRSFAFSGRKYLRFLLVPWKVVTFLAALAGMWAIAPYSGDPTWDHCDAFFMSVLTFAGAPWAVGALYRSFKGKTPWRQTFVAFCVWMFSVSWSYDLYILFRDGRYPAEWLANMFASSTLYIPAGLLWNLAWSDGKGVIFSFMEEDWPGPPCRRGFSKVFWYAMLFIAFVAGLTLYFLKGSGVFHFRAKELLWIMGFVHHVV